MKIPFVRQKNDYFCGPAVLAMALRALGIRATQQEAARRAGTTKKNGTSAKGLIAALKSFGVRAEAGNRKTFADIKQALKKNRIVIVCYTEKHWDWGHYAVVKKIGTKTIQLIDPAERHGKSAVAIVEFKKRWKDPLFTKTVRWAAFVG